MTYDKQTWHDLPVTDTPISAARLGHIEDGIELPARVVSEAPINVKALNGTYANIPTGAAGDNTTDDTASIQATLDAIDQYGVGGALGEQHAIYFPRGDYIYSNLTTPQRIRWTGEGAWATILRRKTGSTGTGIKDTAASGGTGIQFDHINFDGNNTAGDLMDIGRAKAATQWASTGTMTNCRLWQTKYQSLATTTLATTMDASQTTVDLTSAASFPTSGRIKIENEYIAYTGKSTNTLTGCTRGDLASTAAGHTSTVAITEGPYIGLYGTANVVYIGDVYIFRCGLGAYLDGSLFTTRMLDIEHCTEQHLRLNGLRHRLAQTHMELSPPNLTDVIWSKASRCTFDGFDASATTLAITNLFTFGTGTKHAINDAHLSLVSGATCTNFVSFPSVSTVTYASLDSGYLQHWSDARSVRHGGPVSFGINATSVNPTIFAGTGSPESVVSANPGSLYLNRSGGTAVSLYVKESGSGNTGWIGK